MMSWLHVGQTRRSEKVIILRFTFGFCDSQTRSAIHKHTSAIHKKRKDVVICDSRPFEHRLDISHPDPMQIRVHRRPPERPIRRGWDHQLFVNDGLACDQVAGALVAAWIKSRASMMHIEFKQSFGPSAHYAEDRKLATLEYKGGRCLAKR